jgi:Fe-S-cluster containining protein
MDEWLNICKNCKLVQDRFDHGACCREYEVSVSEEEVKTLMENIWKRKPNLRKHGIELFFEKREGKYFFLKDPETKYCTMYDQKNQRCSIYDTRPSMCKNYFCKQLQEYLNSI